MDGGIRASDDDRERVVTALRRHVGAGRLTVDEFSERSAATYRARTHGELADVLCDLPTLAPASTAGGRLRVGHPGLVLAGVAAVVALLAGGALAFADPASAHVMGQMMNQAGRMCGASPH